MSVAAFTWKFLFLRLRDSQNKPARLDLLRMNYHKNQLIYEREGNYKIKIKEINRQSSPFIYALVGNSLVMFILNARKEEYEW